MWAVATRCDPEESIDILRDCWSDALDPRLSPAKRAQGDYTQSRAIIDATRPYAWRDRFPCVSAVSDDVLRRVAVKFPDVVGGEPRASHVEHVKFDE